MHIKQKKHAFAHGNNLSTVHTNSLSTHVSGSWLCLVSTPGRCGMPGKRVSLLPSTHPPTYESKYRCATNQGRSRMCTRLYACECVCVCVCECVWTCC